MAEKKNISAKKRLAIGAAGALTLAVVGTLVGFMAPGGGGGGAPGAGTDASSLRTVTLERGEIASTVSATGTVYSTDSVAVYSNLSYPVGTVYVEVGDTVEAGDVLAELDVSALEADIAQKKASVSASQATAAQNLAAAKKDLETYERNSQEGYDTNLLSAENSVTTAELDLQTAELEVAAAADECRTAKKDVQDARDIGEIDENIDSLKQVLRNKELALEKAQASREKAQVNLEKARASLEAAQVTTGDSISTYEDKVKSAELSTNFNDQWIAIQKLEDDLEKAAVTATVSGTVTEVIAEEGGSGSGKLFVIQNAQSLKVVTNIKEYDIDAVSLGDKVIIKTDATGDTEFTGTLSKIAPTSTLTTSGSATASTDAEYESEVTVTGGIAGLRIGMNARLSIVTEEKSGVFSVPYEAVETEGGISVVYALNRAEDGAASLEAIPVEKGLETNLYVEVTGDNLKEGMEIVKNASNVDKSQVADSGMPGPMGDNGAPDGEPAAGGDIPAVEVSEPMDEAERRAYAETLDEIEVAGEDGPQDPQPETEGSDQP